MELVVKSEAEAKSKKHAMEEDECRCLRVTLSTPTRRAVRHHVGEPGVPKKHALRTAGPDRVIRLPRFQRAHGGVSAVAAENLPPEAICEEIENGLVDNLHCSKIWNVESTDPVVDLIQAGPPADRNLYVAQP